MNVDIDQIIGFVVTLFAMIYLMIKSTKETKVKNKNPEDFAREKKIQTNKLKDFLKSLEDDMENDDQIQKEKPLKQKKALVAPKPIIKPDLYHQKSTIEDRRLQSSIEERKFQTSIEGRHLRTNIESRYDDPYGKRTKTLDLKSQNDAPSYNVIGKAGVSKANEIISGLKSKKQMIILNEIISPPKSLRNE